MSIFTKNGGMMNVIRCDQKEYLVWKWRPDNADGHSKRENGIRYNSALRVKDGEVAVFVYTASGSDNNQDFIVGPYDKTIKTGNFPILSSLVGLGFGGDTPFQAEVYFINLSDNLQIRFSVPYFDVTDPRYPDLPVPVAARGTITFNITDYKAFIKLNRLIGFEMDDFKKQISDAVSRYVKSVIANAPIEGSFPLIQIERQILDINNKCHLYLRDRLLNDFGVNVKGFDLAGIDVDKSSEFYIQLKSITADVTTKIIEAQRDTTIKNIKDMQEIGVKRETLRAESDYLNVHAINLQSEVAKTAAESLGKMGGGDIGGEGGFNPAPMMTGMMMGGAIGGQMAGMINNMGQNLNAVAAAGYQTPPPVPNLSYYVLMNGQQVGPCDRATLMQMVSSKQLTLDTYVWKAGMAQWDYAKNTELSQLFPQIPPAPPIEN